MRKRESGVGFFLSLLLHTGLFFPMFLGGFFDSTPPIHNNPPCTVPIDIECISDVSQAPVSRPKSIKEPKPREQHRDKEAVKVDEELSKDSQKKEQVKEEEKPKEEKKEEKPKAEKKPDNDQDLQIDAIENAIKKAEKKKPEPKKKKTLKGEKNDADDDEDFMRVLKDVEKDKSDDSVAETPMTDKNSKSRYGAGRVGQLSISIIDRVRRQLESCWRIPLGAHDGGKLVVVVRLEMNPDATVRRATVIDSSGTPNHPAYAAAAESALRAVHHKDCNPLLLPLDQYETWKVFDFRFIY